jgi:hypothetical protein
LQLLMSPNLSIFLMGKFIYMTIVPFPRLHFFIVGIAPLVAEGSSQYSVQSVRELTTRMFDSRSMMTEFDIRQGRYLTAATMFRGKVSTNEVESAMLNMQKTQIGLLNGSRIASRLACVMFQLLELSNQLRSLATAQPFSRFSLAPIINSLQCSEERHTFIGTPMKEWMKWSSQRLSPTCTIW